MYKKKLTINSTFIIPIVRGTYLVFFELIDNTGLQTIFETGTLFSSFDTNTRNHQPVCLSIQAGLYACVFQSGNCKFIYQKQSDLGVHVLSG